MASEVTRKIVSTGRRILWNTQSPFDIHEPHWRLFLQGQFPKS